MKNEFIGLDVSLVNMLELLVLTNLTQCTSQRLKRPSGAQDSLVRSVARSLGRSVARSIGRSVARSLGRSLARSLARSIARSVAGGIFRPKTSSRNMLGGSKVKG